MILTYKDKLKLLQDPEALFDYKKRLAYPTVEACLDFINNFVFTYDPRNEKDKVIPFLLFTKQIEFIEWLWRRFKNQEDGAVDKCRDIGATWCFIAFSIWMICFQKNISIALFTFKASECDRSGDTSTLFGKCDFILERLPIMFKDGVISKNMHIRNELLNSDIVGASGDNPLRSNRRSIIFKDEAAFYEQAERIEAAISESSNCKIDVSTHAGTDTIFYRKTSSAASPVFVFEWYDNPRHTQAWFDKKKEKAMAEGTYHIFQREILRNAQASVASVLIPSDWSNCAKICDVELRGRKIVSLDVADEGFDTNAFFCIDGNVPIDFEEWQTDDPNITARKVFYKALEFGADEIRYDCIGVGSAIKTGFNSILEELRKRQEEIELEIYKSADRLHNETLRAEHKKIQKAIDMRIIGWAASSAVCRQDECDYGDASDGDKTNGELFENAKSQAYFKVRNEFLQTYYYTNKQKADNTKLLNFSYIKDNKLFNKFMNEISQPIQKLTARGKIIIDKKGSGKSPNLMEAWVIARAEIAFQASIWDV